MKTKFKFKTEKPTGRWGWLHLPHHYIKLNGSECGSIGAEDFAIRLMVYKDDINEDGNPNCDWKWIKLIYKPESLDDAKKYILNNAEGITTQYKIRTQTNQLKLDI